MEKVVKQVTSENELARLDDEYRSRAANKLFSKRYSYFNEAALLGLHSLERHVLAALKKHNFTSLADKKILDVGCGTGSYLRRFLDYGALPSNLSGIDLMAARIEQAKLLHPLIDFQVGSAHQLPYKDASFDLVMTYVVFSSILDESLCKQIADEIWRVRKPGGLILVYDFTYSNPRNPAVHGVNQTWIKQIFGRSGSWFDFQSLTLAPPVSRFISPHSYWLAFTLESCRVLNTHILGVLGLDEGHDTSCDWKSGE